MLSNGAEPKSHSAEQQVLDPFDLSIGRPSGSRVNLMTQETIEYGRKWQEALMSIALQRARQGTFPRQFAFSHDWKKLVKEIAKDVESKAQNKKGPGPLIVLLGGGGAAGKSTFRKELEKLLTRVLKQKLANGTTTKPVQKLELDQYFYPVELILHREADGKYDNPLNSDLLQARRNIETLKKGDDVIIPVHDRNKHKLAEQTYRLAPELKSARVVIVDGLYSLGPCFQDLGDVGVYIDASPLDRAKGRVWRDINVRKRNEEHVVNMLLGREVYQETFVEPTQTVADYIVRRPHTSGNLTLGDEKTLHDCFVKACAKEDLAEKEACWQRFIEEQKKKLDEESAKAEF